MTAADRIRAALERLTTMASDELDTTEAWAHSRQTWDDAIAAAHAALSQPTTTEGPAVPEGREPAAVAGEPSDEELLELTNDWPSTTDQRHDLSGCPEVPLYSVFADEVVDFARAVLARWGRPVPAPAEPEISAEEAAMIAAPWSYLDPPPAPAGEMGELVETLRGIAYWKRHGKPGEPAPVPFDMRQADRLDRAADLLERQAAPVAVADDYKVASDKTMRRIRSTTKRWKVTVTITTNDSAIDTRLGVGIWKVLDTENETLESVSLPQLLLSNTELPLPSGEVQP